MLTSLVYFMNNKVTGILQVVVYKIAFKLLSRKEIEDPIQHKSIVLQKQLSVIAM